MFGIDKASFYSSNYFLDLRSLANSRGLSQQKLTTGLGQNKMAVTPPGEDVITLAANAAHNILDQEDKAKIDTVIFATETGVDQSKSASTYLHRLLNLNKNCRVIELKQACYGATAGLQFGLGLLKRKPGGKVLLIASDVARYGLNTSGESSQGCGAIAMLLSENPRILSIEEGEGFVTDDNMDFWRPNYRDEALVDGRFSCQLYLKLLVESWNEYSKNTQRGLMDHQHFLYHFPFPKMVEKAHKKLLMHNKANVLNNENDLEKLSTSLRYGKEIGNSYTASLYISLMSLLENSSDNLSGQRVGFYSYGSGAIGEYFSGVIQEGYKDVLLSDKHSQFLKDRKELDTKTYEHYYKFSYPRDGSDFETPEFNTGKYKLSRVQDHKRIYEMC